MKLPIRIWNVDGTHNQGGAITHYTDLEVRTGEQKKTLRFLITYLGKDEVILGVMERRVNTYYTVMTNVSK